MAAIAALGLLTVGGEQQAWAASEQQAKDMVAKAIALYDEKGDAAFAVFDQGKATGYVEGEVYIVVQSTGEGAKVVADGAKPDLVGTLLSDIKDVTGKPFATEQNERATEQGVWSEYQWQNPATGKVQHKKAWCVLHKGRVFIAGIYD